MPSRGRRAPLHVSLRHCCVPGGPETVFHHDPSGRDVSRQDPAVFRIPGVCVRSDRETCGSDAFQTDGNNETFIEPRMVGGRTNMSIA